MIHRYAFASKTPLKEVLNFLIRIVNYLYIKAGALDTRLFKEFCKGMNANHEVLLFYAAKRWLSEGNVVNCFFELKGEIKFFLQGKKIIVC